MQEKAALRRADGHELIQEDYIAGLAKGLTILECFGTDRHKMSVTQVAKRAQITRTAARRHLRTLAYLGYLDSDGVFFWLTHKVLKFAGAYMTAAPLPKIARAVVQELSVQSQACHAVVVLDEGELVTVASAYPEKMANARMLPFGIHTGNRILAHSGSNGKVLLAALSDEKLEAWLSDYDLTRFTSKTQTDVVRFKDEIKEVREQGWALALQEHELGFGGLAVPVSNAQGRIIASLNAVADAHTAQDPAWQEAMRRLLFQAAQYLRALL